MIFYICVINIIREIYFFAYDFSKLSIKAIKAIKTIIRN
jgi:hypothetical protein